MKTKGPVAAKSETVTKSKRGGLFFLIPVGFILLVFVLFAVGIMVKCTTGVSGMDQSAAKEEAASYALELGIPVEGISCVRQDTDGDGYLSCTLKLPGNELKQIECVGALTTNSGCRDPKMRVN